MEDRSGPKVTDIAMAGIILLMIPVSVVSAFFVDWWLAFFPLGILVLALLYFIFAWFWRSFRTFRQQNAL